jgi:catechol 2,3-dioxygenase-like lactoylglutathione lyase family enzyme
MNRFLLALALCLACFPLTAEEHVARPKITGIAHVRLYSVDLEKSRQYYGQFLGFGPGTAGCLGITRPCYTVNAQQQIELTQITGGTPENLLAEVAFATTDAAQMRRYLLAHGISAGAIVKDTTGAQHFELLDPEGHAIAFVQTPSERFFTAKPDQMSTRLFHAGFIVKDSAAEDHFYRDLLGFRMYWHGGFKDSDVDWEELQVPNGSDWIEYMLNIAPNADHQERGIQNHFSFGVPNMRVAYQRLREHGLKTADAPEIGRDGKWSFDIYDPDDTRVEFMEFKPAQAPCCHPYEAAHPTP